MQGLASTQTAGASLPNKEELVQEWRDQSEMNPLYIINFEIFPLSCAWLVESEKTVGVHGRNLGGNVVVNKKPRLEPPSRS